MTAKEFLRSVRASEIEVSALVAQITKLRQDAQKVGSMRLSDMPKGGQAKESDDIIAELVDLQGVYSDKMLGLLRKQKRAVQMIAKMGAVEQQAILSYRYICAMSWDEITARMNYDRSWVYRLHGIALQNFAKIYDADATSD